MAYCGYYINLDRSTDRRAAMEAQLARLGLTQRYLRFVAIDGAETGFASPTLTNSEFGCFASHHMLLRQHRDTTEHLHIVEDDVVLATRTAEFVEWIIESGMLNDYDLLFTDMAVPADAVFCRGASSRYKADIRRAEDGTATNVRFTAIPYFSCAASYLVSPGSVGLICDMLGQELERGAGGPIDTFIHTKAVEGKLRVKCLFPFITSITPGRFTSTIRPDDFDKRSLLAVDLLRHSFFVECDLTATLGTAEQWVPDQGAGLRDRLFARVLGFIATDEFQPP